MIKLVLPNTKYKQTYIEATKEFQEENNQRASNYLPLNLEDLEKDFEAYVTKLLNQRPGIGLLECYVLAPEYWITDEQKQYR